MDLIPYIGQGNTGKIAPTAGAAHDDIGIDADLFHLFLGFETDNGLMEHNMIKNAAQGILGMGMSDGVFNGFADGNAQAPR
jgi:hypothetical protein